MTIRQFQDLTATVVLAVVGFLALLVVGPHPVTLLFALPLLLVLPGYALVSAIYPDNGPESVGPVARLALSTALSVAITPAVAFAANYTVGVYPRPVLFGLAAITGSLCFVAAGRRAALESSTRAGPTPFERFARVVERYFRGTRSLRSTAPLEATSGRDVFLNLLVVGAILVFAASVGFAALVPQGDAVTETYLATTTGDDVTLVQDAGGLDQAERESLVAVIENHEGRSTTYTVAVVAQDVSGSGSDVQVEDERVVKTTSGTLGNADTWHVGVPTVDADRTVVRIYRGEASGDPDFRLVLQE